MDLRGKESGVSVGGVTASPLPTEAGTPSRQHGGGAPSRQHGGGGPLLAARGNPSFQRETDTLRQRLRGPLGRVSSSVWKDGPSHRVIVSSALLPRPHVTCHRASRRGATGPPPAAPAAREETESQAPPLPRLAVSGTTAKPPLCVHLCLGETEAWGVGQQGVVQASDSNRAATSAEDSRDRAVPSEPVAPPGARASPPGACSPGGSQPTCRFHSRLTASHAFPGKLLVWGPP